MEPVFQSRRTVMRLIMLLAIVAMQVVAATRVEAETIQIMVTLPVHWALS